MELSENKNATRLSVTEKVKRFYDIGSPYYLKVFGKHIHDGYYLTGKESRDEAQENLIKLLVDKAKIQVGSKILDVGCGIGGSSIWLAKNLDAQTVGITISPGQIEIAEKMAQEQNANSVFLLMNAEEMDFSEPFDVVWLVAALTHFNNQENFFRLAARHLRKKGKFIFYDWTINEDISDLRNDGDIRSIIEGMVLANLYSNNDYLKWLMEAGYRITYTEDITAKTLKTWSVALSLLKKPAIWEYVYKIAREEGTEVFSFLKSLQTMKRSMLKGKVKASVIVAEKI
ncbi:MAG TPA: class I SAM-dependent methyltransferase [Dehalococcoidales bacterium]